MKEKSLTIFNHFGTECQERKLAEEVYEFFKAYILFDAGIGCIENVIDEFCDVELVLNEFKEILSITDKEKQNGMEKKANRTLERIKNGYYEKEGSK